MALQFLQVEESPNAMTNRFNPEAVGLKVLYDDQKIGITAKTKWRFSGIKVAAHAKRQASHRVNQGERSAYPDQTRWQA